jgi:hypothetical protein
MVLSIMVYSSGTLCWLWNRPNQKTVWYLSTPTKSFFLPTYERRSPYPFQRFFINQFKELAQRFSLSVFNEIGNPTSRRKTLRSIASTAFYNLFKKKINIQRLRKRATFFLAKQSFTQYWTHQNKNKRMCFLKHGLWTGLFL